MGLLDEERQRRIDERARRAADASFATIEPAADDAAGVHRVDLGDEPMRITPGDYGDAAPDPQAMAYERMTDEPAPEPAPPAPPAAPSPPNPAMAAALDRVATAPPVPPAPPGAMAQHLASPWVTDRPPLVPSAARMLAQPQGIIEPGNIDLGARPVVHNADGTVSTVRSMSYGTDRGERLVPTVSDDGRIMSDDEAMRASDQSGRHLGIFASPELATAFAQQLHDSQAQRYGAGSYGPTIPDAGAESETGPASQPEGYGAAGMERMLAHIRGAQGAAPADEPEAVDNPAEEAQEPASRIMSMLGGARGLASPVGEARFQSTQAPLDAKPPVDAAREAAAGPLPRLDAGLPTEEEIASRRDNPLQALLHSIQNGLRGAIGQPTQDYGHQADELAAERRAGLRTAVAGKAQGRQAERTAERAAQRQEQQDALAQQRLGLEERRTAATEAMVPARIAATEAGTERTRASTQHILTTDEVAAAERTGSTDPQSDESIAARLGFRTGVGRLPTALRSQILAESGIDPASEDFAGMSARQLSVANAMLERISVGATTRTGAGGSGGVSAGREAVIAEYMRLLPGSGPDGHMTREEAEQHAAAMRAAPAGSRTEIGLPLAEGDTASERARLDRTERGVAILPGVYADAELVTTPVAQRALQQRITNGATQLGSLQRLQEIGEEYGRTGALDPRAEADLVGARSSMMHMVAELENSGIVGPSDMPRIQAAIPNPADFTQANLGTLPHRLESFRAEIDRAARIQLRAAGVTEEGLNAAIRFMHGGGAAPARPTARRAAAPTGETVQMIGPTGRTGPVAADRVEAALAAGYRRAP